MKQDAILISSNVPKVPLGFIRTADRPRDNLPIPTRFNTGWWWSRLGFLLDSKTFMFGWPFRTCIEQQAVRDLPHLRLAVCAVEGILAFAIFAKCQGISQLVVTSGDEDILGLVQWDIGLLLNCRRITLETLESYVHCFPSRQIHTPSDFLLQRVVIAEQDVLIKSIKLAIWGIVQKFGKTLDQIGLDGETAMVCQGVWDGEFIK